MVDYKVTQQPDGYWHISTPGSPRSIIKSKDRKYLVWLAATVATEANGSLTVFPDTPRRTRRTSLAGLEALFSMARIVSTYLDVAEQATDARRLPTYATHARSSIARIRRFLPQLDRQSASDLAKVIGRLEQRVARLQSKIAQSSVSSDAVADEKIAVAC